MKVKYEAPDDDKVCDAEVSLLQALNEMTLEQKVLLLKACIDKLNEEKPIKYNSTSFWYCECGHKNQEAERMCIECKRWQPT